MHKEFGILRKITNCMPGLDLERQHAGAPLLCGPLHISIVFFIEPAKSLSIKKKKELCGTYHVFKPDLDNLIKMVCDISSGIIFKDDCIISQITAKKIYDSRPRTEFYLKVIE
jgi:Holliday junction resolvase RusA-like endonuclease